MKPSWSTNNIKRISKQIRHNQEFDVELFDQFIAHASDIIEHVTPFVIEAAAANGLHELDEKHDLIHQSRRSGGYLLSSRPKTRGTTIEKIRRAKTNLDRIDDIAGIRIDAAITLTQQKQLAHTLKESLIQHGAKEAMIKDHLEEPNSGYRALHVIGKFPAGRVEIQIRTALQSLWANTYEVLADKLGRRIRYEDWVSLESEDDRKQVDMLHELSDIIYEFEQSVDRFKHYGRERLGSRAAEEIELQHSEVVRKIEELQSSMRRGRPNH